MNNNFTFLKAARHFRTITKHKFEVSKVCFMAGIYWQGITHDLSKYSFSEFISSVKYYQGTSSPIDAEKLDKGYSLAWLHHRGRNPHHWEYWIDNLSKGGEPLKIPVKYVTEMVCDFIGSGKAYLGNKWVHTQTYNFFMYKLNAGEIILHPETEKFLNLILLKFYNQGFSAIKKENILSIAKGINY